MTFSDLHLALREGTALAEANSMDYVLTYKNHFYYVLPHGDPSYNDHRVLEIFRSPIHYLRGKARR